MISATGIRPELLRRHCRECGARPTALRGSSTEVFSDDLPVVPVQTGDGQVQHDAPHGRLYPGAAFYEVFAQGADLGRSEGGAGGPQTQLLVEHVGGGTQQPSQLIGEEAAAAGAVDFQAMMQLFDPILDVPAGAVDRFVQMPGRVHKVGDHEARVVFGLALRVLAIFEGLIVTLFEVQFPFRFPHVVGERGKRNWELDGLGSVAGLCAEDRDQELVASR